MISAPAKGPDLTCVLGVNDDQLSAEHLCVSNASCTTNCLAPLVKPLHEAIGVKHGIMTTIHAYTNDQVLTDVYHKDLRRARSGTMSQIPTSTGAAKAVGLVLPELNGKLDGFSMRVPTINVSVVDLTVELDKGASYDDICAAMKAASASGDLAGVLDYTEDKVVATDFRGRNTPSIFDAGAGIQLDETFVKVVAWYDNEYGYTCNMLRMVEHVSR